MVRFKNRYLTIHVKQWVDDDGTGKTKQKIQHVNNNNTNNQQQNQDIFSRNTWFDEEDNDNNETTANVNTASNNNKNNSNKDNITVKQFFQALVGSLQINFGDYGLAMNMTSLHCYKEVDNTTLIGSNNNNNNTNDCNEYTFIVRCARDYNQTVHGAITFINEINDIPVTCSVIKKRGVIRNMANNKQELGMTLYNHKKKKKSIRINNTTMHNNNNTKKNNNDDGSSRRPPKKKFRR